MNELVKGALGVALLCHVCGCGSDTASSPPKTGQAIEFVSGNLTLKGTLDLPTSTSGPTPAVVLVAGSGAISRDSPLSGQLAMNFGCTIRMFPELSQELARVGYAVLRFDKRSCGSFNGCAENGYPVPSPDLTIDAFIDDVEAALDWLARQPEVDPHHLFVVGHSEGASYVPRLTETRADLAAGVMIAGPFRPIDAILSDQVAFAHRIVDETGTHSAQTDAYLAALDDTASDVRSIRAGTFTGSAVGGAGVPFWRSWLALGDAAPTLAARSSVPLLALSGDYDWNVPPDETRHWTETLGAATPNPGHRTQIVPCVTHALNCISQPDFRRIRVSDIDCHVSPRILQSIVDFLAAH